MDVEMEKGTEDEGAAGEWVGFLTELRYAKLGPKGWHEKHRQETPAPAKERVERGEKKRAPQERSLFVPGPGKAALAELPPTYWLDVRREYAARLAQRRFATTRGPLTHGTEIPPGPGIPGAQNWIPIGPSVVRKGQATGNPPISGRVAKIAVAPGGMRAYAAAADGGVWRSDDGGASWRPTMDGFDIDPTAFATTSNACGAVAIDPMDPDRVYVGTGEGETDAFFSSRLLNSLPSYRGVGPLRSDTGGDAWVQEPTAPASPTLVGTSFFALAVDPGDRDHVIAATTGGLYRREPDGAGGYHWVQKRTGRHTSVIACRSGSTTTFFAAQSGAGGGVFTSTDGIAWTAVGTGLPTTSRTTLGARPTDPSVVYAYCAVSGSYALYRLDGGAGAWKSVSGLPSLGGFPDYTLPISVDPNDATTIYIAGTAFSGNGSIYRCAIAPSGSAYSMTSTFIGSGVHADVHALAHAPGDSSTLFAGCDGGVFRTTVATGAGTFKHRNTGLATLSGNFFSQHPTQLAVVFLGLQDNGTARYTGEEAWLRVNGGDGGYPVVNWNDPTKVLSFANGTIYRATDGGQGTGSFASVFSGSWAIMVEPIVTTPYKPASPGDAETVAFADGTQVYVSPDFGTSWPNIATLPQNVFALALASPTRLYAGTTLGQVYRFDKSGSTWTPTRIDNVAAGALPVSGLITDIEVDPADATGASVYVTFGGAGDQRHVWYFNGTSWANRSGPASGPGSLLDVETNAIVADPLTPSRLFVACDVGVWESTDGGGTWNPQQNGLPDAAVFDLQIHPTGRILRAGTHGRGMFEYKLDALQIDTELYVRDTALDVGRATTVDGLPDPETWPTDVVRHYLSRNIKVDVPTPAGYQTPSPTIDFLAFNDTIVDGSQATATMDPALGTVVNRVYVEVHNRSIVPAASTRVMLILANASMGVPPLPAGYASNVQTGTPLAPGAWRTVGTVTLSNLRSGFPQVAEFNLPSTMLPPPADLATQGQHFCLLALVHSSQDAFTGSTTSADNLALTDRKVGQRNLWIVPFVGTPPPPSVGTWARVDLNGLVREDAREIVIDARRFRGRVSVLLPPDLHYGRLTGLDKGSTAAVESWSKKQTERLHEMIQHGRYDAEACRQMILDIRHAVHGQVLAAGDAKRRTAIVHDVRGEAGKRYPIFLHFQPEDLKQDAPQEVHVVTRDAAKHNVVGGGAFRFVVVPKPKQ